MQRPRRSTNTSTCRDASSKIRRTSLLRLQAPGCEAEHSRDSVRRSEERAPSVASKTSRISLMARWSLNLVCPSAARSSSCHAGPPPHTQPKPTLRLAQACLAPGPGCSQALHALLRCLPTPFPEQNRLGDVSLDLRAEHSPELHQRYHHMSLYKSPGLYSSALLLPCCIAIQWFSKILKRIK